MCVCFSFFLLNRISRYSPRWPGTHRDPPVSANKVLELKACATMPGDIELLILPPLLPTCCNCRFTSEHLAPVLLRTLESVASSEIRSATSHIFMLKSCHNDNILACLLGQVSFLLSSSYTDGHMWLFFNFHFNFYPV